MTKAIVEKAAEAEHRAVAPLTKLAEQPLVAKALSAAKLADEPPLLILGVGTLALGMATRRATMIRSGARMVASHVVATGMKTVLKASVDRRRPALVQGKPSVRKGHGTDDKAENAFPSGHTAGAVAVAQAVAHEAPAIGGPARLAAGLAGAMQVPRGAHYVTDVLSGAAVGWLAERIAGVAIQAVGRLAEDRTIAHDEAEAEAHPS